MRNPEPMLVSNDVARPSSRDEPEASPGLPEAEPAASAAAVLTESRVQNALSVVMMAGIAFLPIVIAAGFLSEHLAAPSVPREVSMAALRGPMDAERHALADDPLKDRGPEHPAARVRAGF